MSRSTLTQDRVTKRHLPVADVSVGSKYFGKDIAGTYLLRECVEGDDRVFLRLVTVMSDGTWLSSHARQHSREFGFTNQQGVWLTTGPNEITAKAMDFNYNPLSGDPTAVSRVGFVMRLNPDSQEVRGEMFGERYHLDQNPLNTEEVPLATFGNTFTGQRIRIDG